jgi:hypothetical protein
VIQLPLSGVLTEETIVPYLVWRNDALFDDGTWYPQLGYDAHYWTQSFWNQNWFICGLLPQTEPKSLRDITLS